MSLAIYYVDAFTDKPFRGNSAAVVILERWLTEQTMQAIATENNLSETAFLCLGEDGLGEDSLGEDGLGQDGPGQDSVYDIRWFSPFSEIDFCGHATLASAFILFDLQSDSLLKFRAPAVGVISVQQQADGSIEMYFPNRAPEPVVDVPEALLSGLSFPPDEVLLNRQAYFAVYNNERQVREMSVDLDKLKTLAPYDVVVTAPAQDYDFISRYFWPAHGGEEDPVTGSIHAGLAPYWGKRLQKTELVAYQASKRGGSLRCALDSPGRVKVSGKAVKYMSGQIEPAFLEWEA